MSHLFLYSSNSETGFISPFFLRATVTNFLRLYPLLLNLHSTYPFLVLINVKLLDLLSVNVIHY